MASINAFLSPDVNLDSTIQVTTSAFNVLPTVRFANPSLVTANNVFLAPHSISTPRNAAPENDFSIRANPQQDEAKKRETMINRDF